MMNKKILIIGIFTTLLLLITPFAIADNLKINKCNGVTENQKVVPLDIYEEIITQIEGVANGGQINKRGLIRDVELRVIGSLGGALDIYGWRKPFWERYHVTNIIYIHAYRFIGVIIPTPTLPPGYCKVYGIAIGNIDWIK